jgi:hypothetical protein
MSTLAANNITDAAGTGGPTLANGLTIGTSVLAAPSGSAPSYTCRAWVNFDGTTNVGGNCTVRASGNVSSVTDNGTGDYTVNLTTAMPDVNYVIMSNTTSLSATSNVRSALIYGTNTGGAVGKTTSAFRLLTGASNVGSNQDMAEVHASVFR